MERREVEDGNSLAGPHLTHLSPHNSIPTFSLMKLSKLFISSLSLPPTEQSENSTEKQPDNQAERLVVVYRME